GRLLMAAVGPLTAGPLEARGVPALLPARSRMGALVRAVVQHFDPAPADAHQPAAPRSRRPAPHQEDAP
ncbi:MAG: uroporphyrinogen-III synthase, partial [Brachybacterium paraconglomeratum]|nr:uroporphyrinogen-III synthase [Brachybacterium paraconglomeratum]